MPPGTGDVAISLGQLLPRAEVLVVTTPQPAAQEVASRAAVMAQKTNMRLLGVGREHVLLVGTGQVSSARAAANGSRRARRAAPRHRPARPRLREHGDLGDPLVEADPESETAREIVRIAEAMLALERERGIGITKPLPVVS